KLGPDAPPMPRGGVGRVHQLLAVGRLPAPLGKLPGPVVGTGPEVAVPALLARVFRLRHRSPPARTGPRRPGRAGYESGNLRGARDGRNPPPRAQRVAPAAPVRRIQSSTSATTRSRPSSRSSR